MIPTIATRRLLQMMLPFATLLVMLLFQAGESRCETYQDWLEQAHTLFQAGHYDSAIAIAQIARGEAVRMHGAVDTSVATVLFRIGGYYYALSDRVRAEEYWSHSLALRQLLLGENHLEVAKCLNNLANVADMNGQYMRAESLFIRAIRVRQDLLGPDDPQVGRALNGLAITKMNQDRYPEAEQIFTRALMILERDTGPESPEALRQRFNLGLVLLRQGKYGDARETFHRVVAATEKIYGKDSPENCRALSSLALISRVYAEYDIAESLLTRSISILETSSRPDHPDLCVSLLNLANVYRHLGRWDRAEEVARRYLTIAETSEGDDNFGIAQAWTVLARIYYDKGDSADFRDAYGRALSFYEQTFDLEHQFVASGLQRFSWHFRPVDATTCLRFASRAFDIRQNNLLVSYAIVSEFETLRYAKFMRDAAANYLSCYFDMDAPGSSATREACDVVLTSKGQVSDEIIHRRAAAARAMTESVAALNDSLGRVRRNLSTLYVSMSRNETMMAVKNVMDSLYSEKIRLESLLAERGTSLRGPQEASRITGTRVASELPDGGVLVEYMKYNYLQRNPDTTIAHYLAVVLKSSGDTPILVDLGPAKTIDSMVALYHQQMETIAGEARISEELERYSRALAMALYALVWQPIEKEVAAGDLILVAPDGALNFVSYAGLIDPDGAFLVEAYPIHYVSSGRDMLRLAHHEVTGRGLLAMGDPDYDANPSERMSDDDYHVRVADTGSSPHPWSYFGISRNVRSQCRQLQDSAIPPLPGTRNEIERVAEFWLQHYDDSVYSYVDKRATEDNLKRMAQGKRVIHLATHGFYTPASCFKQTPGGEQWWLPEFAGENPLLLSGLFLAGCNVSARSADSLAIDDGVLTAEEVSGMDLSGVEWIVLSACESGLGEVETGEGVYGLRRAFQTAGARTVISSLWPVGDRNTADFMAALFTGSEQPLYRTMRQYQLAWIEKSRQHGYSDHPYLWAAFVTTGDWR